MPPACCDRFRRYLRPRIEQYLRTDVGQPYRDIAAPTPAGDTLSLRQAVEDPANKCVLVDFWASWCGPCISGMNRIKQLYETYRAAGLEVIGVSLDSRREAWLRAIEKEGLPWSNISNLDGWQTGFDSYGIQRWIIGSCKNALINNGTDPNYYADLEALEETARVNPFLNFTFDRANVEGICARILNVYYEYGPQIDNGVAGDNWEELYNNYMAARKDAGIEELVTEFQNQLNAYIEANNITSW